MPPTSRTPRRSPAPSGPLFAPRAWAAAAILGAIQACGGDGDVVLSLTSEASCEVGDYAAASVIAVDVYGYPEGELCIWAKRCVFMGEPAQDLDGIADALRGAEPPLVEVDYEEARWVTVVGHEQSCWGSDDHVFRGTGDLADSSGGGLDIALQCDIAEEEPIPFCP